MKSILSLALALFSFSVFSIDACPVNSNENGFAEKVSALASKAESCSKASDIVTACALGSGQDVQTVNAAIARCNKDIKLTKTDSSVYSFLNHKCYSKYDAMEGSMYLSMTAFCNLSVTTFYAKLFSNENL